jgi:hypothetical protein
MLFLCVLLLACFGHGYLWVGWVNRIHAWAGPRWIIDLLTILCVLAFVGIPLLLAYSWLGWHLWGVAGLPTHLSISNPVASTWQPGIWQSVYIDLCALGGGGKILWRLLGPRQVDHPKTLLEHHELMLDLASQSRNPLPADRLTKLMCLLPANQVLNLSVEKKQIALPRLNRAHEGLSIAHLSDLHMTGRINREFFQLVADEVNALKPDIIALTGDILENEACRPWLAESLGRMQSRYGKYFILGNHDLFVDSTRTRCLLSKLGWTDVGGRRILVPFHGTPAVVTGNELPWFLPAADLPTEDPLSTEGPFPTDDPAEKVDVSTHRPDGRPFRLVLTHSPDQFAWCCQRNSDLVLAGHTHGGQVCLPLIGPVACPSKYGTRYIGGVYREEGTVMHVTRGISGETPIRWNCPPELALLELVKG